MKLPARVAASVDNLVSSTTHLRVPLLDNVIQVGTAQSLPAATIAVSKTPSMVEVRRTDGAPLRAQILTVRADGAATRIDVFTAPVDVLRLRRTRQANGPGRWLVDTTAARRDSDLLQLVETIVSFAIRKQNRITATAGVAALGFSPPQAAVAGL